MEYGLRMSVYCIQERNACANAKGDVECFKSRLMIRDDMRHSSLSDAWVDYCYCSLSFIVVVLLPVGTFNTHAYITYV